MYMYFPQHCMDDCREETLTILEVDAERNILRTDGEPLPLIALDHVVRLSGVDVDELRKKVGQHIKVYIRGVNEVEAVHLDSQGA